MDILSSWIDAMDFHDCLSYFYPKSFKSNKQYYCQKRLLRIFFYLNTVTLKLLKTDMRCNVVFEYASTTKSTKMFRYNKCLQIHYSIYLNQKTKIVIKLRRGRGMNLTTNNPLLFFFFRTSRCLRTLTRWFSELSIPLGCPINSSW